MQASDGAHRDKVHITWDSASGAGYHEVHHAESASGAGTLLGSPPGTWYDDTSAAPGTIYHYWVKACNACDYSSLSAADEGYRSEEPELSVRGYVPLVLR